MTRVRVIPVLLLAQQGIVKTAKFSRPRYLGDPINAVRIFNQKLVDELVLLDIEATERGRIEFDWIGDVVSEAFMPIAYGGGIRTLDDCAELFKRGVEKIVINSAAAETPDLVERASARFGAQAVVVSIDTRRDFWGRPRVQTRGGRSRTGLGPVEAARQAESLGAGEILLTSIDREGTYTGYDLEVLRLVSAAVALPVIAHGGAGSIAHFVQAVVEAGCSAVAAGSMFVFAAQAEGVLISYPTETELQEHLWSRVQ
jgi:cyclase